MQKDEWRHEKKGVIRVGINNDYMIEAREKNAEDRGGLRVCDSNGRREKGTAALVIKPLHIYLR